MHYEMTNWNGPDMLTPEAELFKALADETRLRLALALRRGELCVCQLVELVGLAPSTVSQHLSVLRHAGLVETRKEGRWVYYRLAERPIGVISARRLQELLDTLATSPQGRRDARRLSRILKTDPEVLCSRQRNA